MKPKILFFLIPLFLFLLSSSLFQAYGEEKETKPDTSLCAKMIRFGIQSHERKKYLDAKEYFRKALQADPSSDMAWRYYDLTVIYALAEKVKKNQHLIEPDVSASDSVETAPPLPQASSVGTDVSKDEFKIVDDDEGCY